MADISGNTQQVHGTRAHDAADGDNPVKIGGYASDGPPSAVSTDADRVNAWFDKNGRLHVLPESIISSAGVNSSTSTLGSGAAFTGTGEEVTSFEEILINVVANVASATDGLSLQQSSDGSNWDIVEVWTVRAGVALVAAVSVKAKFFRVVYTNGGSAQSSFRLQTIFKRTAGLSRLLQSGRAIVDGLSREVKWIKINATASGDNTVISSVSGKKLRLLTMWHTGEKDVAIIYKSGSNTLINAESFAKNGGLGVNKQPFSYVLETNAGEAFIMNLSATLNVRGSVTYVEV